MSGEQATEHLRRVNLRGLVVRNVAVSKVEGIREKIVRMIRVNQVEAKCLLFGWGLSHRRKVVQLGPTPIR